MGLYLSIDIYLVSLDGVSVFDWNCFFIYLLRWLDG